MKVTATIEIIEYYDNQDFDTYDISKDTIRQIDSAIRTQKYKAICLNDPDYLEDFEDCKW